MTASAQSVVRPLLDVDNVLLLAGVALLMIGLIAIGSASIEYADWHFDNPWPIKKTHMPHPSIYQHLGGSPPP